FKLMAWRHGRGLQGIKWSTEPVVTPFINIDDAKFAYVESLKTARRVARTSGDAASADAVPGDASATFPASGVAVIPSPNTGEKLTAFWRALPPQPQSPDLLVEIMAT